MEYIYDMWQSLINTPIVFQDCRTAPTEVTKFSLAKTIKLIISILSLLSTMTNTSVSSNSISIKANFVTEFRGILVG